MADLVDLDEAKAYVGFVAGTDDETLMEAAQVSGNQVVRDYLGWDPLVQDRVEVANGRGVAAVFLAAEPIVSVTSCYIGTVAVPPDQLVAQGRMLLRKAGVFPKGTANVTVTYRGGYVRTNLHPVMTATKMAIKALWSAFKLDPNFASPSMAGVESASFYADGPGALPQAAKTLLQPKRRVFVP